MAFRSEDVRAEAERQLAELWGEPVRLEPGSHRRPNAGLYRAGDRSVFLKMPSARGAERYDPDDDARDSPVNRWTAESTALSVLAGAPVPELLAHDRNTGLLVLEAMCETSLAEVVLEGAAADARRGLIEMARALAQVHRVGRTRLEAFRARWPRRPRLKPLHEALQSLAVTYGLRLRAVQQCEAALAQLEEPGPFRTVVHNDPCPDNVLWTGERAVIVDFESACTGHLVTDLAYLRMAQPTCWCAYTAPLDVVEEAEAAYREASGLDVDDAAWTQAIAVGCVAHFVWSVHIHYATAAASDVEDEEGPWSQAHLRKRLITRAELLRAPLKAAGWSAAAEDLSSLAKLWRLRFRSEGLSPFPAFELSGE